MKKITWAVGAGLSATWLVAACAGAEDSTIVVVIGPDGAAGQAGAGATGGAGGSTGGTGGSTGGTGGTGGSTGGSAGAGGSTGGAGGTGGGSDGGVDASTGGTGGALDAGKDAPDYDASGPCTPNQLQEQVCGACGTRARICDSTGTWLPWGACTGETGECAPGTQLVEACGKCGTITYFCSAACVYLPGPCENEGICTPGELTVSNASCPAGEVRTSLCTAQCGPGNWSQCSTSFTWKSLPVAPLSARREVSTAWNGTHFVVAGGYGSSPTYKNDAALYEPVANKWTMLPAWPSGFVGRERPGLAATTNEIVIWGGYDGGANGDGIKYSFSNNTWTSISTANSPGARYEFAYAWDAVGQQLIVFGGRSATSTYHSNLHAYKPATDTWTALPTSIISARAESSFAWDPARRWLYIFGGYGGSYLADGAVYDASANKWRVLPPVPSGFQGRENAGAVVADDKFIVFGGYGSSPTYKEDGIFYDPITHSWTALPAAPIDGRYYMVAVSNGSKALFWGGNGSSPTYKDNGAVFDPSTMQWTGVSYGALVQSPTARGYHPGAEWTPQGVIIWGGYGGSYLDDGKIYLP